MDGHFAFESYCLIPIDIPQCDISKDVPVGGKFRFRLPFLWAGKDFWWHLSGRPGSYDFTLDEFLDDAWMKAPPEYSPEQIASVVGDAMEKIEAYGLPYFRQIAKELTATEPH